MQKSIVSREYKLFLSGLREARRRAGFTQGELAKRLGQTQSFISKCERGERRIDVIELRAFCKALGVDFVSFVTRVHKRLGGTL